MSRFYNPGTKWEYRQKFDNPTTDASSSNISYYLIAAPAKDFFEVKDTQTIKLPTGEEYEIPLRIKEFVRVQYAELGVVLVDPAREHSEQDNISATDEEAKVKGDRMWKQFTIDKCNEWISIVEETRGNGRIPKPASGLFKHCLDERHIADPADMATNLAAAKEGQKDNKDLQAQLAALTAQVNQLLGAKGANKGA